MSLQGLQPQLWKSGPDPVRHAQYRAWIQQKNQAQWRVEGWAFEFEDWVLMWGQRWNSRGKRREHYCMTRIDTNQPWTPKNCHVVTRQQHARNQGGLKITGQVSRARQRLVARQAQQRAAGSAQ
jgi:hypothetical protein